MSIRSVCKATLAGVLPQSVYLFVYARIAARDIASRRRWAPEIEQLSRFVKPGDTVIDVGGNHGLYSYHLSRLVGPQGRVHTFEPIPPNLSILRYTIKHHGLHNVTVYPVGCGAVPQKAQFSVSVEDGVLSLGGARQGGEGVMFDCEIVRLDDVISTEVSFLKIDVEGAELFVLQGAENLLRRCHPVILFEAGDHTASFGYPQQEVFDYLTTFGYQFFSGGFTSKPLEPRDGFTAAEDYFCIAGEVLETMSGRTQ